MASNILSLMRTCDDASLQKLGHYIMCEDMTKYQNYLYALKYLGYTIDGRNTFAGYRLGEIHMYGVSKTMLILTYGVRRVDHESFIELDFKIS